MLPEQEQWKNTGNALSSGSNRELSLLLVVESTTCILVDLQLVDGGLKEAVKTDEARQDLSDDEPGRVIDASFRPGYLQANAHAVLGFQAFNDVLL